MLRKKKIDLVVIGNLAYQEDHLVDGRIIVSQSGSGYYVAAGASLVSQRVGLIATVGGDFKLTNLEKWGVDLSGVKVTKKGKTARFVNIQLPNGNRSFKSKMGVASDIYPELIPTSYLEAKYIHLASNHPQAQLFWLDYLQKQVSATTIISADAFELFVRKHPGLTSQVFNRAGLLFANEEEWSGLQKHGRLKTKAPLILKKGHLGATYLHKKQEIHIPAPKVKAVDTSGPGEILAGTFLALSARRIPIVKALKKAIHLASLSVTRVGVEHLH